MFTATIAAIIAAAAFTAPTPPAAACIDTVTPAQVDYDGSPVMQEDESPAVGLYGGRMTAYDHSTATYADGTTSNGVCWRA